MTNLILNQHGSFMDSINFEFLSEKLPELEALGAFAEKYIYPDPGSCGVKLRLFGETQDGRGEFD